VNLLALVLAAASYCVGGVFMKLSRGLSVLLPSVMVFLCFGCGAAIQGVEMRHSELSINYVLVLGLEAGLALLFSIVFFREGLTAGKAVGALLIVLGIALLRRAGV
jgi:multidrug transporter EmrE-like cation transporter